MWFIEEIWPLVTRKLRGVRLRLIGSNPSKRLLDLRRRGVDVTGFINDLEPVYRNAAVAIAPLRSGAGVKFKVLQALAYGRPVVSTAVGVEGIEVPTDSRLLGVANDPQGFAERVIDAYQSRGDDSLSIDAHSFVVRNYSFDRSMEEIGSFYRGLLRRCGLPKASDR
jgi:glycosyltransferase involved in cell wall biosynthesis